MHSCKNIDCSHVTDNSQNSFTFTQKSNMGNHESRINKNNLQCSSEISEPKCASNTRTIRVYVYTHTSIDIRAYAYTNIPIRIQVCVISMYELAYCFFYCGKVIVDLNGHCNCSENDAQAAPNVRRSSCVSSGCVCSPLSNAVSSVLYKCYISPKSPQHKK